MLHVFYFQYNATNDQNPSNATKQAQCLSNEPGPFCKRHPIPMSSTKLQNHPLAPNQWVGSLSNFRDEPVQMLVLVCSPQVRIPRDSTSSCPMDQQMMFGSSLHAQRRNPPAHKFCTIDKFLQSSNQFQL